jgi:2-amino-4-hydroxy-6-hydroxymethyldihydropteridine diphosphokinase
MTYNYLLSLGSNVEPRYKFLSDAITELSLVGTIMKKSSIYETEAWKEKNQSDYYNAIVKFDSPLPPRELLQSIKKIEKSIGRQPTYRWGPREIDIDIIFCQDYFLNESDLKIPHPEFAKRRFVLEPILEIDKDYSQSDSDKTITDILSKCEDQSSINKLDISW